MSEGAPRNKVAEELTRLKSITSGGGFITMRDNLQTYLSGREHPNEIKNISNYNSLDRYYREFTDAEICELINGLK